MQKIPLNLAQAGMVLAKPVTRENGMVLVAEGTELSENVINRLQGMEVPQVVVKGEPLDLDDSGGGSSSGKRLERMDHLFRGHQEDPWMQEVKSFFKDYFRSRAAMEASAGASDSEEEE